MKKISIVIPVYFNEQNLLDTVPRLIQLTHHNSKNYLFEIIFVDDGSKDNSLSILIDYQRKYPDIIRVAKLSRNFGSMAAIAAGFSIANGDCVGVITADLQDPPELFVQMIESWEKGNKLILAVRENREDSFFERKFSNLFYKLVRKYALESYPPGGFDFLLADKQIITEINKISEKNTNIMSLIYWTGFDPVLIPYTRKKRKKGKSRWTFSKKIKLFLDTFVGFSYVPIRALSAIGLMVAIASFLYGAFILLSWIFWGTVVQGWVPMMIILTFTAGIQMLMLGVLGEYLWRGLDETRKRPLFIIDKVYEKEKGDIDGE
ncbi:MAG: glycosyltransferase family 2 protein [Chloroflexi bacterium]|nr:glycosyltransferase family 2 protein [Chloroflexota bacterium]